MDNNFRWEIKPLGYGFATKKKRKTLSAGDRIYIWERPKNMEEHAVSVTKK